MVWGSGSGLTLGYLLTPASGSDRSTCPQAEPHATTAHVSQGRRPEAYRMPRPMMILAGERQPGHRVSPDPRAERFPGIATIAGHSLQNLGPEQRPIMRGPVQPHEKRLRWGWSKKLRGLKRSDTEIALEQPQRCLFDNGVEVMGFEPTASTLRMWGSWASDQGLHTVCPGGNFVIPSSPLISLPFPLDKVTQGHAFRCCACDPGAVDFDVAIKVINVVTGGTTYLHNR